MLNENFSGLLFTYDQLVNLAGRPLKKFFKITSVLYLVLGAHLVFNYTECSRIQPLNLYLQAILNLIFGFFMYVILRIFSINVKR